MMPFSSKKNSPFNLVPLCFVLCISYFLTSCDSNRVFEENKEIKDYVWKADERIVFDITITDTVSPNNLYVNIRNADDYRYSNIYVFITTTFPNGKFSKDTLECILADDKGHWLGNGLGDIWDNQIPFKKNVRFPEKGKYTIALEQAMRMNELPQIMDVGVRIEKQSH